MSKKGAKVDNYVIGHNPQTIVISPDVKLRKNGLPDFDKCQVEKTNKGVVVMAKPLSNPAKTKSKTGKTQAQINAERIKNLKKAREVKAANAKKKSSPKKNPSSSKRKPKKNPEGFLSGTYSRHVSNIRDTGMLQMILFIFIGIFICAKLGTFSQFVMEQFDYKKDADGKPIKKEDKYQLDPKPHPVVQFFTQAILTILMFFISPRFGNWGTSMTIGFIITTVASFWNNSIMFMTRDDKGNPKDDSMRKIENIMSLKISKHTAEINNTSPMFFKKNDDQNTGTSSTMGGLSVNNYGNSNLQNKVKSLQSRIENNIAQLNGLSNMAGLTYTPNQNRQSTQTKNMSGLATTNKKLIPYQTKNTTSLSGLSFDNLKSYKIS